MSTRATKRKAEQQQPPIDDKPAAGVPLFEGFSEEWAYIAVERVEPIEERGYLGMVPIDTTEDQLRQLYGGGKYQLRAKTNTHQVKSNCTKEIAGDPIFQSEEAEQAWRRRRGARPVAAAAPPAPAPLGVAEILGLFQAMQQQTQAQLAAAAETARQERAAAADADRRREDSRREQEKAEREERRREEDRREERRREEEERRERARAAELEQARARDREHVQTILQVVTTNNKQSGNPIEPFMQGLTVALKLGGRGDDDDDDGEEEKPDPVAATIRAAIEGIGTALGKKTEGAAPAAPAADPEKDVRLTGQLGDEVRQLVEKAKAKGQDPEKLIRGAVQVLGRKLDRAATAAPATAASSTKPNGATVTDLSKARAAAAKQIQAAADAIKPDEAKAPETPAS